MDTGVRRCGVCDGVLDKTNVCACSTNDERKKASQKKGRNTQSYQEKSDDKCTLSSVLSFFDEYQCPCTQKHGKNCVNKLISKNADSFIGLVYNMRKERFDFGEGGAKDSEWYFNKVLPLADANPLKPERKVINFKLGGVRVCEHTFNKAAGYSAVNRTRQGLCAKIRSGVSSYARHIKKAFSSNGCEGDGVQALDSGHYSFPG